MISAMPTELRSLQRELAHLSQKLPKTMAPFSQLHSHVMASRALSGATKELIAMAISIGQGCSGCVAYHGAAALRAGASRDEFLEAVEVAILMAGGPGTVYATEAMTLLDGTNPSHE